VSAAIFEQYESSVRVYCRQFPALFVGARGHEVWDATGRRYIDFISGAGALNYGHNHPLIKRRVIEYLEADGVVHGLDFHTEAKRAFIDDLVRTVLRPRGLDYKLQFTGPTGTNAVEAAFKLARRVTGRVPIIAFTNAFHGMTLGALAATGSRFKRGGAAVPLHGVTRMPYDGYLGPGVDTIDLLERVLDDAGSGIELPAAIIVEVVQGEGGLATASPAWLRRLVDVARRHGILIIVDEIQTGCGRTGTFFGFEEAGIDPDLVCLSKSLSGLGLPLAVLLHKASLDVQAPGEHSGTFRGNNLGFVGGSAALALWAEPSFEPALAARVAALEQWLEQRRGRGFIPRGRGLIRGLGFADPAAAKRVSRAAFELGMLVETSGARGEYLKLMPPITIDLAALGTALDVLDAALRTGVG
jgi:diaminobutyrate-2-oxoglutarate transaminase